MNLRLVLRFYGSCGHTTDEPVSLERFTALSTPHEQHPPIGEPFISSCETTVDGGAHIVHVVPMRYACCLACSMADPPSW